MQDPYKLLGVSPLATDEEIKRAFREKSRENHPDHGGSTEKMAEINIAYKKIDTAEHRAAYDAANSFGSTFKMWESVFGKCDIAKNFAQPPKRDRQAKNGSDLTVNVKIDLSVFINGAGFMTVPYKKTNECIMCSGTGVMRQCKCSKCGGAGKVHSIKRVDNATIDKVVKCRSCHGTGMQVLEKCSICEGTGEMLKDGTYSFRYKAGTTDMKVIGKGNEGSHGGENGNLLIHFDVQCPDNIKVHDGAICVELPIYVEDAVLTRVYDIDIGGRLVTVRIPIGDFTGEIVVDNIFGIGLPLKVRYSPISENVIDTDIVSAYEALRKCRK